MNGKHSNSVSTSWEEMVVKNPKFVKENRKNYSEGKMGVEEYDQ